MKQNENMKSIHDVNQLADLRSQIQELVDTKAKLEKTIKENQDFMTMAGHELKTPLMVMRLRLEARKRKLARGQYQNIDPEILEQMFDSDNNQLNLLASQVEELISVSRTSPGSLVLNLESFNICTLVQEIVAKNVELAKKTNVDFHIHAIADIWGRWDKLRIEQVITNLLTNAIRYGNGRPVKIQISIEGSKVVILFKDQGIGIAKENLERIFQKYEQVGEVETQGLGLGLYIVKQIVEAHKGSISVVSQKEVGSVFRVELPLIATTD